MPCLPLGQDQSPTVRRLSPRLAIVPAQGATSTASLSKSPTQTPLTPEARRQIHAATGRPLDPSVLYATQLTPVQEKAWEDYLKAEKLAERRSQSELIADRTHALREEAEATKQRAPIGARARSYVHRDKLTHPHELTPISTLEDSGYVQLTPEKVKAVQSLPGIAGPLDELDEIVQRRSSAASGRPVLFPRSTGDARRDRANERTVAGKGWLLGKSDPGLRLRVGES